MIYLIAGPGRTGSTWLTEIIRHHVGADRKIFLPSFDPEDLKTVLNAKVMVVHTHDQNLVKTLNLQPENISLIISRRKNKFTHILSHEIARHTGEYGNYTNKEVIPFEVALSKFKASHKHYQSWYAGIDFTLPYYNVSTIFYEDIVTASTKAGAAYKTLLQDTIEEHAWSPYGKSPYTIKKCISNWEELYDWYRNQPNG